MATLVHLLPPRRDGDDVRVGFTAIAMMLRQSLGAPRSRFNTLAALWL